MHVRTRIYVRVCVRRDGRTRTCVLKSDAKKVDLTRVRLLCRDMSIINSENVSVVHRPNLFYRKEIEGDKDGCGFDYSKL